MFKFSILKHFPSKNEAREYVIKAEKEQMKFSLEEIYEAMNVGKNTINIALNGTTIAFLKEKGYTVKKSSFGINYYDVSW